MTTRDNVEEIYVLDSEVVVHRPCELLVELARFSETPGGLPTLFGIRATSTWVDEKPPYERAQRAECFMLTLTRGELAQLSLKLLDVLQLKTAVPDGTVEVAASASNGILSTVRGAGPPR